MRSGAAGLSSDAGLLSWPWPDNTEGRDPIRQSGARKSPAPCLQPARGKRVTILASTSPRSAPGPSWLLGLDPRDRLSRNGGHQGFTLVELLVVLAIILTIAAIAIPNFLAARDVARVSKAIADIYTMEKEIMAYQVTNGSLPHTLADIGRGTFPDPWGNPYQYLNIADDPLLSKVRLDRFLQPINSDYDLYSKGKDGLSLPATTALVSADDVIRANDGAYVGLASQY